MKPASIFLTGATGHLGHHVAQTLVHGGYKVAALVRRMPDDEDKQLDINYIVGDLLDPNSYVAALHGTDAIIHAAAEVSFGGRADQHRRVNLDATVALLENSRKSGLSRFVYVSSRGTRTASADPRQSNEFEDFRPTASLDAYMVSKLMAEQAVIAAAGDMACIVVSPTALIGGMDRKPGPAGALVNDYVHGKARVYLDGGINLVDVHDAATATVSALTRGCNGGVYFLGGNNISMLELYQELAALTKIPPPSIKIPTVAAYMAATGLLILEKMTGRPAQVTPKKVLSFRERASYCVPHKASNELTMPQTPLKETLADAVQFFAPNGFNHG